MKVFFRKAIATVSLFALLAFNVPPTITVPQFIEELTTVPTVSAADDNICEPSEIDSPFTATNLTNTSYVNEDIDFTWAHNGDNGDCDDKDFTIRVYSGTSLLNGSTAFIPEEGGIEGVTENYTYDIDDLPGDGTYSFRLFTHNFVEVSRFNITVDTVAPTISSAVSLDTNVDGTIDRIDAEFNETIDTAIGSPATGFTLSDGATVSAGVFNGQSLELSVSDAPANNTEFTPTISGNPSNVRDLAGNTLDLGDGYTTQDGAQPILLESAYRDVDGNGFSESLYFEFTETIDDDSIDPNNSNLTLTDTNTVQDYLNVFDFDRDHTCDYTNNNTGRDDNTSYVCIEITDLPFDIGTRYDGLQVTIGTFFLADDQGLGLVPVTGAGLEDEAGPVITEVSTRDLTENGFIDAVRVAFSENIEDGSVLGLTSDMDLTTTVGEDQLTWTGFAFGGTNNDCNASGTRVDDDSYLCITFNEIEYDDEHPNYYGDTGLTPDLSLSIENEFTDLNLNFAPDQSFTETTDQAKPLVTKVFTRDLGSPLVASPFIDLGDNNGRIDAVELRFSENIDDSTLPPNIPLINDANELVDGYTIRLGVSNFFDLNCAINNPALDREDDTNYLCVPITEITEGYDTGVEPIVVGPSALYSDLAGNQSVAQTAEDSITSTDGARPLIVQAETKDLNLNEGNREGLIDAVKMTFSEGIDDETIEPPHFVVAGYPSVGFNELQNCVDETARVADSDYICLELTELSTPFSTTFTGDTGVTPVVSVQLDNVLSADLEGNRFYGHTNIGNETGVAVDTAGPVLNFARTASTTTVETYFSEAVEADSIVGGDLYFPGLDVTGNAVSDNDDDNLVVFTSPTAFSSNYDTGTVEIDGTGKLADLVSNTNVYFSEVNLRDNILPVITSVTLTSAKTILGAGDTATLTVDTDASDYCAQEDNTCLVTVNGIDVTSTLVQDEEDDSIYRFTYTVSSSHSERSAGTIPVSVRFEDDTDNFSTVTEVSANTLSIDFPTGGSGSRGGGGGGGGSSDDDEPNTPSTPNTSGFPFTDTMSHWSKQFVETLYDDKVINGKDADTFGPDDQLTRAEITKIAMLAFDYPVATSTASGFSDVDSSAWYATYVTSAKQAGIISGYSDGTFRPNAPVTRAEALKILLTAAKLSVAGAPDSSFTDVVQTAWYADFVDYAFDKKIVSGLTPTTFGPDQLVTRGQVAKMTVLTQQVK